MDTSVQPDVLSQPTRARLFALLGRLGRPAPTDEIAARLDLHPNGIRAHLERMREAGLVERRHERLPRGRPRDTWSISPEAQPGGGPPSGYTDLARWLARSMACLETPAEGLEEAGRAIGRELLGQAPASGTSEQRFFDSLSALGFAPAREPPGEGHGLSYRLRNCPYREAVHEPQHLVCALHRGLTRGMLEAIDPASVLTGFEPEDPDLAGCRICVGGSIAAQAPAAEESR